MLSVALDPDLEQLLAHDVDDLARYNILRYLHDHSEVEGDVLFFANELGLRSPDHVGESLEALVRRGLLVKIPSGENGRCRYRLSPDPDMMELVDRLYRLSSTNLYGEIVEQLAARSLHRARKALASSRGSRKHGDKGGELEGG